MANAHTIPKTELMEVDVDRIKVEEGCNARTAFDPDELQGLSEPVEDFGVTQTLRLRPTADGYYTIVAGERRYRGAKAAGLKRVPAMVGELTEREAQAIKWIENRHRSDLNPIEEAHALKALAEEWELTAQKAIAAKARIKPQEVGVLLRLLDFPDGVQCLIASGDIPVKAEKRPTTARP
ncbi:MAG TPA: ParB/RepB/Spo0J family partition protein [Solirubrobacterales bacterium]|nr:ParB/RepB/Spo0J family partition protein [Solirubrobacterales bacterium]